MGHDVTVIGSANLDVVVPVPRIPEPGETVLATAPPTRHPGGKGLNQAVACARAGARTGFVGAVGDDPAADVLLAALREVGVDVGTVARRRGVLSGTAHIAVRPDGENAIVVVPGANGGWAGLDPAARAAVSGAALLLAQLEVDLAAVAEAAALAREPGRTVVLNAAPAPGRATDVAALLGLVDLLVVNEHEAAALAREHGRTVVLNAAPAPGRAADVAARLDLVDRLVVNEHEAAALAREHGRTVVLTAAPAPGRATDVAALLDLVDLLVVNEHEAAALASERDHVSAARALAAGARDVVVTLGARGALLVDRDGTVTPVPAPRVEAVDTTGAGDAFVGALAAATALGAPLPEALRRACAAGALAVQLHGAVPSLPTRAAVDALLRRR
ncbi:ribokinase [Aquipuribacter sp. MA13-6]|uniref:ribokinase n=1 Tax=Aquipuribacter sp. MA13-6 TaxID=3440839 RepID=UPI003EEF9DEF